MPYYGFLWSVASVRHAGFNYELLTIALTIKLGQYGCTRTGNV